MSGFGIENLPYGVFRHNGRTAIGVAYEGCVLDLARISEGLRADAPEPPCRD